MKDKTLGIPNLPQKKTGVPLLVFAQSFNKLFSSSSEGSQTILTISEYGCRTSSHWSVNFNSNIYQCIFFNGYLTFFTCSLAYQGHGFDILLTKIAQDELQLTTVKEKNYF